MSKDHYISATFLANFADKKNVKETKRSDSTSDRQE